MRGLTQPLRLSHDAGLDCPGPSCRHPASFRSTCSCLITLIDRAVQIPASCIPHAQCFFVFYRHGRASSLPVFFPFFFPNHKAFRGLLLSMLIQITSATFDQNARPRRSYETIEHPSSAAPTFTTDSGCDFEVSKPLSDSSLPTSP